VARVRADLGFGDGPVAVALGGLYEEKRLPFLIEACDAVQCAIPDFRLLIVGEGPSHPDIERLASTRSHVRLLGPLFDADKVRALAPASILLAPGSLGLTIVDSFALELPVVTTAAYNHGPEIEYLVPGDNGLIVEPPEDVEGYARAVVDLLRDPKRLAHLRKGCRRDALRYTNEAMVERFAEGVLAALDAPPRWELPRLMRRRPAAEAGAR
jgi:glycosyltransferase involved in cell wall biosynthesis